MADDPRDRLKTAEAIVEATGRGLAEGMTPEKLARALSTLALGARFDLTFSKSMTPKQRRAKLTAIHSAARRLVAELNGEEIRGLLAAQADCYAEQHGEYEGLPPVRVNGDGRDYVDYRGDFAVKRAADGARLLQILAGRIAQSNAQVRRRHRAVERELIGGQLPALYKNFFAERFIVGDWQSEEVPAARFVNACLVALGREPVSVNSIELHRERHLGKRRVKSKP